MVERQLMRRAFPVLLLVFGAISGCKCSGDVSPVADGGGGPTPDGGPNTDGGGVVGPDGGIVDPCEFIYCPPPSTDGGPVTIGFGNTDGGQGFTLDGGTAGSMGNGVTVDPMGRVTLSSEDLQLNFALIANYTKGTVSKYDTKNLLPDGGIHEVGRYISVIPIDGKGNTNHSSSAQVYNPSRTAIDINSDFWVANFSANANQYFSATKIAGNTFDCIDRNGNGVIDTSFDNPATPGGIYGVIDPSEYFQPKDPTNVLEYDECVLFTQELGNINPNGAFGEGSIAIARGIEGAPGDVWVGTWIDRKVFRLDPATGVPKPVYPDGGVFFPVPDIEPYGAAVDALNRLWVVGRTVNTLALINANDPVTLLAGDTALGLPRIVPPGGIETGGYGIAVDGLNRVWIPAWAQGPYATVFTPDAGSPTHGTWTQFDFTSFTSPSGTKIARPRGIATDVDGKVWMTSDSKTGTSSGSAAMVFGIDGLDGGSPYFFATDAGPVNLIDATDVNSKTSIGVGLDQDGNLWINNSSGNVMRVDHITGAVIKSPNQVGALYSYSDFTGYQLRHITTNQGSFYQTVAGCSRFAQWNSVTWDATTPPNTSVVLYVRGSNNFDFTLSQQYGPWLSSPANLQGPPGPVPQFKYLQLQFVLVSADQTSQPYLNSFGVNTSCNTPIN
jgi:large repetitive protein